jgi:phosphopantothenoylcysteine synthetase/decarboxylase
MSSTKRFLVTAGNTREMIDRVRDWGNVFTGNTGFAIARALADLGEVDLLTSNRTHVSQAAEHQIAASPFTSHADLKAGLAALMARHRYDAIFMTAAVADYRPAGAYQILERTPSAEPGVETWVVRNAQAGKVKSNHPEIAFLGQQTEKLIDLFRTTWRHEGLLFKFKLEVGITPAELIQIGEASRRASGADYLVANTLDMVEGDAAGAYLLSADAHEFVPRSKLATRLAGVVGTRLSGVATTDRS